MVRVEIDADFRKHIVAMYIIFLTVLLLADFFLLGYRLFRTDSSMALTEDYGFGIKVTF